MSISLSQRQDKVPHLLDYFLLNLCDWPWSVDLLRLDWAAISEGHVCNLLSMLCGLVASRIMNGC